MKLMQENHLVKIFRDMTNEEKAREIWNKTATFGEDEFLHYWRRYLKPAMDYKDDQFKKVMKKLKTLLYPYSIKIGELQVYRIIRTIGDMWEGGEE